MTTDSNTGALRPSISRRLLLGQTLAAVSAAALAAPVPVLAADRVRRPREEIDRLMVELRDALAALGTGPMRVIVDSDRHPAGVVLSLSGYPIVGGHRAGPVPVSMMRVED